MCIRDRLYQCLPQGSDDRLSGVFACDTCLLYTSKDGHDEASGIFKVLANNVVEIIRPSSGETSYYKVKDANSLIMTDSLGNEPEGAMAKHYVLTKKR